MKVAIIGSRDFVDYELFVHILRKYSFGVLKDKITEIISGGAKGTDSLAERYSKEILKIEPTIFYPDWVQYGKIAGFMRNTQIIESADLVLAFWDGESKGTKDSINKAKKLNKKLIIIKYKNYYMKINHIVAMDACRCIGGNNSMLWKQREDMKMFKTLTSDNIVIMGRKTFESIGSKPLPNRLNIVISRKYGNISKVIDNVIYVGTIWGAISVAKIEHQASGYKKECFIIGGGEIYKDTLSFVDKIFLTNIKANLEGDTWYPQIPTNFKLETESEWFTKDDKNEHDYQFSVYTK